MSRLNAITCAISLLLVASAQQVVQGAIRFVKQGATGSGTSWADASGDLQAMINASSSLGTDEVWVAAGTYKPGTARTSTFSLKSGVKVFGGFAGTESSLEERDYELNETILSGDLNGDDEPNFVNRTDNCYHVVTATGVSLDPSTELDGFTITGGNADGQNHQNGAGLWIREGTNPPVSSNPRVFNCIFENNIAKRATTINGTGGAVHSQAVASTANTLSFQNCVFRENAAGLSGGACYISSAEQVDFIGCTFSGNSTIGVPTSGAGTHGGGGLYVSGNSSQVVTLIDSVFRHNSTSAGEECGRESFTDAGGGI